MDFTADQASHFGRENPQALIAKCHVWSAAELCITFPFEFYLQHQIFSLCPDSHQNMCCIDVTTGKHLFCHYSQLKQNCTISRVVIALIFMLTANFFCSNVFENRPNAVKQWELISPVPFCPSLNHVNPYYRVGIYPIIPVTSCMLIQCY